jgi:HEPN domain-containing protein
VVTSRDVDTVVESVVESVDPEAVIVFGSVARTGRGNDLDLAVVLDCDRDQLPSLRKKVSGRLRPFYARFAVDPFVFDWNTMRECERKGSPFLDVIFSEGNVVYMKDACRKWNEQAREELRAARYLFSGDFFRGACYHAQQALERHMKAELLRKGWRLEKTHNIGRLVSVGHDFGVSFGLTDDDVDFMDHIYRGRYPADAGLLPLGEPTREDAERALEIVQRRVGTK